ncbi:MAG: branched-chain amino acid aminotransferase [FCB group bacterium]|jgi:branched-chain amino acid aminotransferase
MPDIKITKAQTTRMTGVDWSNLRFGVYFSDHMYIARYKGGKWDDGEIMPYGPLPMEPGLCTLHYGQSIFEGLKAFKSVKGGANIFRPEMNAKRLNHSGSRVCIPPFDVDKFLDALKTLVILDNKWIPQKRGESLYIRPVVFGSSNFLGVHAADEYLLIVMTSPVASYYAEGLSPVKIMVSNEYVRAVRGGLGSAKTAANYAASLLGGMKAKEAGYAQVLWLDAVTRNFVDEVGAMNIVFVIDNEIITPSLEAGTILAGVTRDSVLTLARQWGMKVSERAIEIGEVMDAHKKGLLQEIFGTGTAAVISPVGHLRHKDTVIEINNMKIGPIAQKLYDTITSIQYGEIPDEHGWITHLDF